MDVPRSARVAEVRPLIRQTNSDKSSFSSHTSNSETGNPSTAANDAILKVPRLQALPTASTPQLIGQPMTISIPPNQFQFLPVVGSTGSNVVQASSTASAPQMTLSYAAPQQTSLTNTVNTNAASNIILQQLATSSIGTPTSSISNLQLLQPLLQNVIQQSQASNVAKLIILPPGSKTQGETRTATQTTPAFQQPPPQPLLRIPGYDNLQFSTTSTQMAPPATSTATKAPRVTSGLSYRNMIKQLSAQPPRTKPAPTSTISKPPNNTEECLTSLTISDVFSLQEPSEKMSEDETDHEVIDLDPDEEGISDAGESTDDDLVRGERHQVKAARLAAARIKAKQNKRKTPDKYRKTNMKFPLKLGADVEVYETPPVVYTDMEIGKYKPKISPNSKILFTASPAPNLPKPQPKLPTLLPAKSLSSLTTTFSSKQVIPKLPIPKLSAPAGKIPIRPAPTSAARKPTPVMAQVQSPPKLSRKSPIKPIIIKSSDKSKLLDDYILPISNCEAPELDVTPDVSPAAKQFTEHKTPTDSPVPDAKKKVKPKTPGWKVGYTRRKRRRRSSTKEAPAAATGQAQDSTGNKSDESQASPGYAMIRSLLNAPVGKGNSSKPSSISSTPLEADSGDESQSAPSTPNIQSSMAKEQLRKLLLTKTKEKQDGVNDNDIMEIPDSDSEVEDKKEAETKDRSNASSPGQDILIAKESNEEDKSTDIESNKDTSDKKDKAPTVEYKNYVHNADETKDESDDEFKSDDEATSMDKSKSVNDANNGTEKNGIIEKEVKTQNAKQENTKPETEQTEKSSLKVKLCLRKSPRSTKGRRKSAMYDAESWDVSTTDLIGDDEMVDKPETCKGIPHKPKRKGTDVKDEKNKVRNKPVSSEKLLLGAEDDVATSGAEETEKIAENGNGEDNLCGENESDAKRKSKRRGKRKGEDIIESRETKEKKRR